MHRDLVAVFGGADNLVHHRKIQTRIDALAMEIQPQGDEIDIAGALAIAEQTTFDPVGARHHRQFGGGHGSAAVIVGMDADDHGIPARRWRQNHSIWSA